MTASERVVTLLDCGLLLIEDSCPPDPAAYLCSEEDADDGTACTRCWRRYLFAVANGQRGTKKGQST